VTIRTVKTMNDQSSSVDAVQSVFCQRTMEPDELTLGQIMAGSLLSFL